MSKPFRVACCILAFAAVGCDDEADTSDVSDTGSLADSSSDTAPDSSESDTGTADTAESDTGTPATDDGVPETSADAAAETAPDAAADTTEAAVDTGPVGFCASRPTLTFCDDFDSPGAITAGTTKWDFLESATPPVLTLSTAHFVSGPSSLLANFNADTAPGLRFAKTLTSTTFTEAEWNFDLYVDDLPASVGFFMTDFQFSDDGGGDRYGWRFVFFSTDAGGAVKQARIEHNAPAIGKPDVFEPFLPDGAIPMKTWTHVRMLVNFDFTPATPTSRFRMFLASSSTAAVDATYDAPAREKVNLVRLAGLPYLFDKKAGHKIQFDNVGVSVK